jgi:hypothetical protein
MERSSKSFPMDFLPDTKNGCPTGICCVLLLRRVSASVSVHANRVRASTTHLHLAMVLLLSLPYFMHFISRLAREKSGHGDVVLHR